DSAVQCALSVASRAPGRSSAVVTVGGGFDVARVASLIRNHLPRPELVLRRQPSTAIRGIELKVRNHPRVVFVAITLRAHQIVVDIHVNRVGAWPIGPIV